MYKTEAELKLAQDEFRRQHDHTSVWYLWGYRQGRWQFNLRAAINLTDSECVEALEMGKADGKADLLADVDNRKNG